MNCINPVFKLTTYTYPDYRVWEVASIEDPIWCLFVSEDLSNLWKITCTVIHFVRNRIFINTMVQVKLGGLLATKLRSLTVEKCAD